LLYRLIRYLLTTIPALAIPAPRYEQPSNYNINEADNIEKIRHIGDVLKNSSNHEIDDEHFSIYLSQVK
jgi:hypothetical protein